MIEHYIRGFEEDLREIRHQIHENPELGLQEFKTGIPPYCWGLRVILPKPAVLAARYALSSSLRKR